MAPGVLSEFAEPAAEWLDEGGGIVHDNQSGPSPAPLGEVLLIVETSELRTGDEAGKPLARAVFIQPLNEFDSGARLACSRAARQGADGNGPRGM